MNRILLIIITIAGLGMLLLIGLSFNEKKMKLVWADEFEQQTIDNSKWNIVKGNGCPELCGFGNNELQYYTSDPENVIINDGKLVIKAEKDSIENNGFTSAKLVTSQKGDWQYGRIEVRAKLPQGRGTWPAIWMLPTLDRPMQWPADGEIDIMEHVGFNQGMIYGTIHTDKYNHMKGTQKSDSIFVEDAHQQFHVYGIEWDEQSITWFVDDEQYLTLEKGNEQKAGWPFDQKFHLIVNLAVGGNWGGRHGIDHEIWPQTFVIDYIRVYQ